MKDSFDLRRVKIERDHVFDAHRLHDGRDQNSVKAFKLKPRKSNAKYAVEEQRER